MFSQVGLHIHCMERMLKERIVEGKHKGRVWWHLWFYGKGILRGLAILH